MKLPRWWCIGVSFALAGGVFSLVLSKLRFFYVGVDIIIIVLYNDDSICCKWRAKRNEKTVL